MIFLTAALMAPKELNAQDLTIDYRFNAAAPDTENYLSYKSGIRYIEANKDTFDAISGGFRGLLLFPVVSDKTRVDDVFFFF
jgi:hypothetical protein